MQLSCLALTCLSILPVLTRGASADSPLGTAGGEHLIILGGTFAERLQYYGYFESLLFSHESTRDLVVRNMGWSGDEVSLMPRPYNFIVSAGTGVPDDPNPGYASAFDADASHRILSAHLEAQKADTILLCFGANEAFKGGAGIAQFTSDYQGLIDHLLHQKFNGKTPPRLILVSPIAQEKLGALWSDPEERNKNLGLYAGKIAEIAKKNDLGFVDLFAPTSSAMSRSQGKPLTIDGFALNARGQRIVAEILAAGLGITEPWSRELEPLRKLVVEKNRQFFFRWRPINGEYVYGRRREPFGVISFPPEMAQLDQIAADLELKIHSEAKKLNPLP
ncbi:MAG: SGNH/GDSL hydrolase family protein [Verrucomicrobiales bacterium]